MATKSYYLISWVQQHTIRTRLVSMEYHTDITDLHPVEFLLEARKAAPRFNIALLAWEKLEESGNKASAWKRKLDGVTEDS